MVSLVPPRLNHPPLAFQGPPVEGTATPRAACPNFFWIMGRAYQAGTDTYRDTAVRQEWVVRPLFAGTRVEGNSGAGRRSQIPPQQALGWAGHWITDVASRGARRMSGAQRRRPRAQCTGRAGPRKPESK